MPWRTLERPRAGGDTGGIEQGVRQPAAVAQPGQCTLHGGCEPLRRRQAGVRKPAGGNISACKAAAARSSACCGACAGAIRASFGARPSIFWAQTSGARPWLLHDDIIAYTHLLPSCVANCKLARVPYAYGTEQSYRSLTGQPRNRMLAGAPGSGCAAGRASWGAQS